MSENSKNDTNPEVPLQGDLGGIELRSEEFQEILGSVPHWILRWGITMLALIVGILLIGSAIIKYPDVISAQVVLTGLNPPATVVARSSGKISEMFVIDNQKVEVGEFLAVINNPARTRDIEILRNYLARLDLDSDSLPVLPDRNLQVGNLQILFANFYITLFDFLEYKRLLFFQQKIAMTEDRIVLYNQQYRNLLRQQAIIYTQLSLAQSQFRRDSLLHANEVISNEELERSKNQQLQSILAYENILSAINNMQVQKAQMSEVLLDMYFQDIERFNRLYTQLLSLISQLNTEIEVWELNYVLRSPVSGQITFTNYWTINQNVAAGSEIFNIIPSGECDVIGIAMLPVARSGKVETGQKVNIRLDNFPENEFGILRGTVQNISLVPAQSGEFIFYTVKINLPNQLISTYHKELPCMPNMHGRADIITEDISLLERLILPIRRILSESL